MAQMLFTDIALRALKGSEKYETHYDTKTPNFGIRCGLRSKTFVVLRGTNRERVTIGRYPDMSLSDARTEAKRLLASPSTTKTPRKTFVVARDEYLSSFEEKTHKYHLTLIFKKHFKTLDTKQLSDLTAENIEEALDKIEGDSARLHAFRAVRAFLRWTTRPPRKYIPRSPMEGYEAPGIDKKGTRTLSDDELRTLYKAAQGPVTSVFRLIVLWGTRNAETVAIRRDWVKDKVLTIPGEFTKNGRDHSIPLLPMAQAILDGLPNTGPYYFESRAGEHFTANSLAKVMRQLQADAKLSGFTARDIRRTFRSNMARLNPSYSRDASAGFVGGSSWGGGLKRTRLPVALVSSRFSRLGVFGCGVRWRHGRTVQGLAVRSVRARSR